MERLREANVVRSKRARIKQLMAEGRITLSDVLLVDKCHLRTMKIRDLLLAVPGLGPVKVRRVQRVHQIADFLTLESFSMNRRRELLGWLREHYRSVEF